MKQIKFSDTVNLAEPKFGSRVIYKTDQFFGAANKILNSQKPIFKEGVYDNHGKWMDGWETRRSRGKNIDWIIIKFGMPGIIRKLEIDTHHFKGNYPDSLTIQSALIPNKVKSKKILGGSKKWKLLLGKTKLKPHKKHLFKSKASNKNKINCLRINIFPDGGISRIRAFGKVVK